MKGTHTMRSKTFSCSLILTLLVGCVLVHAPACEAQVLLQVSLDTSTLAAVPGPLYVDFQFNDGGLPGNNTAVIQNSAGALLGAVNAASSGDFSGSLPGVVTLRDTGFFNEFIQEVTPGSHLQFDVALTTNDEGPGNAPDEFSFSLLDSGLVTIPTTAFNGAFLTVDVGGGPATVATAGAPGGTLVNGVGIDGIGAPRVINAVPEPGSVALLAGVSIPVAAVLMRRRKRRP